MTITFNPWVACLDSADSVKKGEAAPECPVYMQMASGVRWLSVNFHLNVEQAEKLGAALTKAATAARQFKEAREQVAPHREEINRVADAAAQAQIAAAPGAPLELLAAE